jgi:hypothetical protein
MHFLLGGLEVTKISEMRSGRGLLKRQTEYPEDPGRITMERILATGMACTLERTATIFNLKA